MRSRVIGCGYYVPEKCLTNHDLAAMVDTSDEWIRQRTGIETRYIAAEGQVTSDLGAEACRRAIENAGLKPTDIDLIVCATSTPDKTFPSVATSLQAKIGTGAGIAFDVQAVCSGFVYALAVADSFIKTGQAKRALVVGAETLSRLVDWSDRNTCVLFGDGAGALVLEACNDEEGIIATKLHADGGYHDILYVTGGVSSTQTIGQIYMNGREVFRHAVEKMGKSILEVLDDSGYAVEDVDWVVPHQANHRIMTAIADRLNLPNDKMVVDVHRHANTSAATIPLAIGSFLEDGKIKKGDLLVLTALGAGLAWGSALIRW